MRKGRGCMSILYTICLIFSHPSNSQFASYVHVFPVFSLLIQQPLVQPSSSVASLSVVGDSWVVVQFLPLMPPLEVAVAWMVEQACALAAAASPEIAHEMK